MGTGMLLAVFASVICHQVVLGASVTRESVFADLSVEEMNSVITYLFTQEDLNLKEASHARLTDSAVFLIEAIRPNKADALAHLDQGGSAPERAARVVINRGDLVPPVIEEYRVSPIPNPTTHSQIKNPGWRDPIPFASRSILYVPEAGQIDEFILNQMYRINDILQEVTGGWKFGNCSNKCLMWQPGLPGYASANKHKIIPYVTRLIEGTYLHPIGVQFVVNLEAMDPALWTVELVWFQGARYANFDEVIQAKADGMLNIMEIPDPEGLNTKNLASSLNFRGDPRPTESKRGPRTYMPDGRRFTVNDRRINWMGWEFEFSMLSSSGIQLHDVKFLNERIAYELSLQEIGIFYSGGSPVPSHTTYYDSFVVLGLKTSELFIGIDCPKHAEFFDFVHYLNGMPHIFKSGACIFEHDRGLPLRRHSEGTFAGGYHYAQGMQDNVLILRQVMSVHNYDYVIDFMFHQAGQIEGKVSLTGYLLNTLYTGPEMDKYGNVVNVPSSIANIHHHIVNIKADLDIKGRNNRFATMEIKLEQLRDELSNGQMMWNRYYEQNIKETEKKAGYKFDFDLPKYLLVYNELAKNKYGNSQGYRIYSEAMSKVLLPTEYRAFRSRAWADYQVAVTKFKESERCSSSIYATMEPYDPVMSFEDFMKDDENIIDQDLVAWLTLGAHHIPHSEDVPIVTTPGVQLSFYLLPYNYFDEDPSLASRDNIRVTPTYGGNLYEYAGVTPDHDTDDGQCPSKHSNSGSRTLVPASLVLILLLFLF